MSEYIWALVFGLWFAMVFIGLMHLGELLEERRWQRMANFHVVRTLGGWGWFYGIVLGLFTILLGFQLADWAM